MACDNFSKRPTSYKVGVLFLVCGACLLVAGYTAPYWKESDDGSVYGGLWSQCSKWTDKCNSLTDEDAPSWLTGVQVFLSLGLLSTVLSCGCTLFESSCWPDVNAPRLLQELTALLGGILSVVGWVVYLANTHQSFDRNDYTYSWAFYLTVIASISLLIASLVLLFCSKTKTKGHDLPPLHPGHVSPATRRSSQYWADSRPATVGSVKVEEANSLPSLAGFYNLPPLPPITPGPEPYHGMQSPSPSLNEPRMSIISMSAEQAALAQEQYQ